MQHIILFHLTYTYCNTKKARNISPGLKTNYEKFILSQKSVRCEATGQQS